MNLQVRSKEGSRFTAKDVLEVNFQSTTAGIVSVVHSIELVSGVEVTHGGGGAAGEFLHYKSNVHMNPVTERITYIDSPIEMQVEQATKGTSVIKIVAQVVTQLESDRAEQAMEDVKNKVGLYKLAENREGEVILQTAAIRPEVIKSNEITLEWLDAEFV